MDNGEDPLNLEEVKTFGLWPNGTCPASYTYVAGDVPGVGVGVGSLPSVDNIESCAGHCDISSNCCSFEYSPRRKLCNLNSECQPTIEVYQDYEFCVKGSLIW